MQLDDPSGCHPEWRFWDSHSEPLKPFHLPLNRTGLWGKLELEQSSFPTVGPAGSMKKQLRVKSINSFITELLQSERYFNCACWEVLMRDTSHFQRGSQGEGIVRQFHSCWLEGNRRSKENVPSCHLKFHSRTSKSLSEIRSHFDLGRFVIENHKNLGR